MMGPQSISARHTAEKRRGCTVATGPIRCNQNRADLQLIKVCSYNATLYRVSPPFENINFQLVCDDIRICIHVYACTRGVPDFLASSTILIYSTSVNRFNPFFATCAQCSRKIVKRLHHTIRVALTVFIENKN